MEYVFEALGRLVSLIFDTPLFFGLFILMLIMNSRDMQNKKKFPPIRRPAPEGEPSEETALDFEVPPLEGAPRTKPEDGIWREESSGDTIAAQAAALSEEPNRYLRYMREKAGAETCGRDRKITAYLGQERPGREEASLRIPPVTPQALATGILYEEILGKPKALRGGHSPWFYGSR